MIDQSKQIKRMFWYVFAGMRGGPTRIRIVSLILERPYNMNQIGKDLGLDYKTVQHHIKVLLENRVINSEEKKYGTQYFPSVFLEQHINIFKEIKDKLKEKTTIQRKETEK